MYDQAVKEMMIRDNSQIAEWYFSMYFSLGVIIV